jgi:hypothetical protein
VSSFSSRFFFRAQVLANALVVVSAVCPGSDATVEIVKSPRGIIGGRRSPSMLSPPIAARPAPNGTAKRSPAPQRSLDDELEDVNLSTPRSEAAGSSAAAVFAV